MIFARQTLNNRNPKKTQREKTAVLPAQSSSAEFRAKEGWGCYAAQTSLSRGCREGEGRDREHLSTSSPRTIEACDDDDDDVPAPAATSSDNELLGKKREKGGFFLTDERNLIVIIL